VQRVFVELMHVMFGPFEGIADQHALTLVMDLEHVEFRLLALPAKNGLEDMGDVSHQVHGIIPAHHQIARFQILFGIGLLIFLNLRFNYRCHWLRHALKVVRMAPRFK